jgi:aspartyl protease
MAARPRAPRGDVRRSGWRALAPLALVLALTLGLAGCALPQLPSTLTGVSRDGKSVTVPARIRHGENGATLVIVDLAINGNGPYPFALDTGASLSLIDLQLARQLDLPVAGPPEEITGVGGAQRVTPVSVKQWAMGAATLPARTITSAPLSDLRHSAGIDGLLGSDVLSSFNSVTIDYANSAVIITPPA